MQNEDCAVEPPRTEAETLMKGYESELERLKANLSSLYGSLTKLRGNRPEEAPCEDKPTKADGNSFLGTLENRNYRLAEFNEKLSEMLGELQSLI